MVALLADSTNLSRRAGPWPVAEMDTVDHLVAVSDRDTQLSA